MQKLKNIKAAKQEQLVKSKGTPVRLSAEFSAETLQARREWHNILKVMKGENTHVHIHTKNLARLSLKFDGDIKHFTDKQR